MQKIKSIIKKVGAISTGAAFLGATLTGAMAADLKDYPTPFVDLTAKKFSYLGVVGADSTAVDNLGLSDITAGLSAVKVPGTGGGAVTVSGGVSETIPVGSNIAERNQFDKELTDSDISTLLDTTISFQGTDYDVSEVLEIGVFSISNTSIETGLTATDDDYKDKIVMEAVTDSIKYYYRFDEAIQPNKTKSSDPLEIKFLGKTLKITSIDTASKFTANVGAEYYLQIGDFIEVNGKEVKLVDVGSGGNVIVTVGGVQDVISADTTKTINGLEVKNDDTFYTDTKAERSAWLVVGTDATESYSNGDPYVGEDEDDPKWIWNIGSLHGTTATTVSNSVTAEINATNAGAAIGIELDHNFRDGSDQPALEVGGCIDLPNNYVSICLDSLNVADEDYMDMTIELLEGIDLTSDSRVTGLSTANVVHVKAGKNDGIKLLSGNGLSNITTNKETNELWLTVHEIFYYDKDLKKKTFAGNATDGVGFAQIQYEDTKSTNLVLNRTFVSPVDATYESDLYGIGANRTWSLNIESLGDTTDDLLANVDTIRTFWTNASRNVNSLGISKSSEEAGEVTWQIRSSNGITNGTNIGTKDENHRTRYGVIIKDPKSSGASDRVELMIPSDQVQANVVIKGLSAVGGSTGSSTGNALATYDLAPSGMLDTQVTTPSNYNLILVGGPAVNRLSAQFLEVAYPAYGEASGLKSGEALLSLKNNGDKVALIVAGWAGEDTQRAATVLKNYEAYSSKLMGAEVKVSGTTASPTIVSA